MKPVVLCLPEPPNVANRRIHWAEKNRYKALCWARACEQVRPFATPPPLVRVHAHFRLHQLMDPRDNLPARLKFVLDCLKQNQPTTGKLGWRNGLFVARGYLWDDDPGSLDPGGELTQEVDRKNRGVTVTIEPLEAAS